jgi:fatty-acyl-CoA synthase
MRIEPDVIASGEGVGFLQPTPTDDGTLRRLADFATLGEALDYAAAGQRGLNFHDARGRLERAYSFLGAAARRDRLRPPLIARGVKPGDRIALIAETVPEFTCLFFGAVYAGAWPVPLPLPTSFGGRDAYIDQLRSSSPAPIR